MNIKELKNHFKITKMTNNNKYLDLYVSYPKYCYGLKPDMSPRFIVTNTNGDILHKTKSYQKAFMFIFKESIKKGDN